MKKENVTYASTVELSVSKCVVCTGIDALQCSFTFCDGIGTRLKRSMCGKPIKPHGHTKSICI
uniref:Uncharacterized protein n=1 Tax=Physcomitrium patens TaxID=3218 RepID=A0A2K1K9W8_PHYPA|nr:hypothetical protein PHYPA_009756 [Physcomitrium patens]